jgi:hypothetical protein
MMYVVILVSGNICQITDVFKFQTALLVSYKMA